MRRLLHRVRILRHTNLRLLAGALYWLVMTDVSLRVLGFERTCERYARAGRQQPQRHLSANERATWAGERAVVLARAARITPTRAVCLQQSLVLYRWLRRRGEPCELCIGVRKVGSALAAHAWVEYDGQVLNDAPSAVGEFAVLAAPRSTVSASAASHYAAD